MKFQTISSPPIPKIANNSFSDDTKRKIEKKRCGNRGIPTDLENRSKGRFIGLI
jgi:hypothetical protein